MSKIGLQVYNKKDLELQGIVKLIEGEIVTVEFPLEDDKELKLEDVIILDKEEYRDDHSLHLKNNQNFKKAMTYGIIVSLITSLAWAYVIFKSQYIYSFAAVIIGFIIGITIRFTGNGIENKFSNLGGILSLLSTVFGFVTTIIVAVYLYFSSTGAALEMLWIVIKNKEFWMSIIKEFQLFDIGLAAIAVYEGMYFSKKKFNDEDLHDYAVDRIKGKIGDPKFGLKVN